jgi:signal transduction histidine kinase
LTRSSVRRALAPGAAVAAILAALLLAAAGFLPARLVRSDSRSDLSLLRDEAWDIRRAFDAVSEGLVKRRDALAAAAFPETQVEAFRRFRELRLDTEVEGVALLDAGARPVLWLGNVADLRLSLNVPEGEKAEVPSGTFLVKDKASARLVILRPIDPGRILAHYRLLAFSPRLRSSALPEYHFLPVDLVRKSRVDFWDFQDDVALFEKIFSGSGDDYTSPAAVAQSIPTLFFPLRGESGRILATVTLTTPSAALREARLGGRLLLAFALVLIAALGLGLAAFALPGPLLRGPYVLRTAAAGILIAGLRGAGLLLARLPPFIGWEVFSPAKGGFRSLGGLTQSPADIALTALAFFLLVGLGSLPVLRRLSAAGRKPRPPAGIALALAGTAAASGCVVLFQEVADRLVANANINLFRFDLTPSFILLHAGLFLFCGGALIIAFAALRAAVRFAPSLAVPIVFVVPLSVGAALWIGRAARGIPLLPLLVAVALLALAAVPAALKRRGVRALAALAAVFFLSRLLDQATTLRVRNLIQGLLRTSVLSQEQWGDFLLRESFPEVERRRKALVAFFGKPGEEDFARGLWERTLPATFNWYSSLEVLDPEGKVLSRFSLNIPQAYGLPADLAESREWSVSRRSVSFAGKERELLVGWKDWYEGDRRLGRVAMNLSLDPELLPFLYSANPYFELLRAGPLPSLDQFDVGFALYDMNGRLAFNPRRITAGVPPEALERARNSRFPFWSSFRDRDGAFSAYYFRDRGRIAVLFVPDKSLRTRAVETLKLLGLEIFFLGLLLACAAAALGRRFVPDPFQSFATRVYAAFLAVSLVPFLFFAFSTRGLFERAFAGRFVEEAASRAVVARSIVEDFLALQEQERPASLAPSEDMVHWVSATLGNDVNLYEDGRLIASSRREFFDSGILPELLDGEAYYRLVTERAPFADRRTAIGPTTFQTLTVPLTLGASNLFVSLPFPFERQEAARATAELLEFVVLSLIFVAGLLFAFSRAVRAMIIAPVRRLAAATREVRLGSRDVRVLHRSRDEMMTLIDGFNAMVGDLRAREQELAEMGRKVAWAEMARRIAHEIKNPLTPIQLSAEHLLRVYQDRPGDFDRTLKESLSYIIGEVENLRRIAQDFMELARDATLRKEDADLAAVVEETIEPYRRLFADRLTFRTERHDGDFRCRIDALKMKTVLRNLLINAIESIGKRGEIVVELRRTGEAIVLEVRDSGAGMDAATRDKVFEPYFSTKAAGTGLGLPIARKIVEDHGGTIRIASGPGRGTRVSIELPVAA